MTIQLDFGPHFAYLAASYVIVAIALGGYFASLVARERGVRRGTR